MAFLSQSDIYIERITSFLICEYFMNFQNKEKSIINTIIKYI